MAAADDTVVLPRTILPTEWTLADVQQHVGGVGNERIRSYPPLGMATEKDVLEIHDRENRLCELVDGVLVEKTIGSYETLGAGVVIQWLNNYLDEHPVGFALPADGMLRILPRRIRIPDACVILWDCFPERRLPRDAVFRVAPDLAVEILSAGNTPGEMQMKLEEYRRAGVRLIWYIDPETRTAVVHTQDGQSQALD